MPTITPCVVRSSVFSRTSVPVRSWVVGVDEPADEQLSHRGEMYCSRASTFSPVTFRGFPAEAIDFYERLEADNSRAFWQANKGTFESAVKAPMTELCEELADYGEFHLFRPYNDVRFAKGRPPYKTAQGAVSEGEGGTGYYVQLSAEGLMAAAGYYGMAKDQLERFRAAVDDDAAGAQVEKLVAELERARLLARRPRRAQVGSSRLRQGPPTHRPAAPQGPDGLAQLAARQVAAHQAGLPASARHVGRAPARCAPGSTSTSGRATCRPKIGRW